MRLDADTALDKLSLSSIMGKMQNYVFLFMQGGKLVREVFKALPASLWWLTREM